MKLRIIMKDIASIRLFAHVISTLHKFSKMMVLRVMKDKLAFLLYEKTTGGGRSSAAGGDDALSQMDGLGFGGGATAWCEIPIQPYFLNFNMEGITPEINEIYLQIEADVFASSLSTLKSSHNVTCLKMKLTRKIVSCLTLEIESLSNNTALTCTHDIPVTIISKRNWPDYECPEPLPFNISLTMPELKSLRLTIERMKNVNPRLTFQMSKEGRLILSVNNYNVGCTVTFSDLHVHNFDVGEDEERPLTPVINENDEQYSVEVDMKSILHLIPSEGAKPTSIICSMTDSRLLHWLLHFGEIQIQYFIPGSAAV